MDWKSLKDKALSIKDKAVATTLEYTDKAVAFADKNLKNTALALKISADFEKAKSEKILVIIAGTTENGDYKKLLAKIPLLLSYAWAASATLRTLDTKESFELATEIGIAHNPTLLVYKRGELVKKSEDPSEISSTLSDLTQFIG